MSVAAELEARTFAVIPASNELVGDLHEAYAAWIGLFASADKFQLPGNVELPSGYVPLGLAGSSELKESFYLRSGQAAPARVSEPSRRLVTALTDVAVAVAADIAFAAGRSLVRWPAAGCLRVMRYPAFAGDAESALMCELEAQGAVRAVPHTDLNALTVLTPATSSGLEIWTGDSWVAADSDGTTLIVQVGRELEEHSGGRWRATQHRVRNPVGDERSRARLSFAFFVS
jgi:hypothetical protein